MTNTGPKSLWERLLWPWYRLQVDIEHWWFTYKRRKREQRLLDACGCVCYCPVCREPLNDQPCELLDEDRGSYSCRYRYSCRCGEDSVFDFGSYPMPVLVSHEWSGFMRRNESGNG